MFAGTLSCQLEGTSGFAPLIRRGVEHCHRNPRALHILLILTTNGMADVKTVPHLEEKCRLAREETTKAILAASEVPLSIVAIGVGDGPWGVYEAFNDHLHWRKFDNFTFVSWAEVAGAKFPAYELAKRALTQIPSQLIQLQKLGLVDAGES